MRRVPLQLACALVMLMTSGCVSAWRGGTAALGVAPSGLPWGEESFRRSLAIEAYDQALARTAPRGAGGPSDPLLRALFRGQAAYYAGDWGASAAAFADADRLADQRITRSASRGVLSLVAGDPVLPYVPTRTERLFAHYYGMLGRLQVEDLEGAAVEARRLSQLLERAMDDLDPAERAAHAVLRDAAGAVFEAAGEWNDAGVAYRNAALLRGTPRAMVDQIVARRPAADSATLLFLVEQGFVAHYVERTLAIPLDDASAAAARRQGARAPGGIAATAPAAPRPSLASRWLTALDGLPDGGVFDDDEPGEAIARLTSGQVEASVRQAGPAPRGVRQLGDPRPGGTRMEIRWPALVRTPLPSAPLRVRLDVALADTARSPWTRDLPLVPGALAAATVSDAIGADARRLRGARLARLTARTAMRVAAVEAVRDQHGEVAGAMAGLLVSAVERADTRGWHTLPGGLAVVRVTVPAGHVQSLVLQGDDANARQRRWPALTPRPGTVHVLATRIWRDPEGHVAPPPIAAVFGPVTP
jgi:hypothetical protein